MWLTAREISDELHVSSSAIIRLRKARKIQYIKLGRLYRYAIPPRSVASWEPPIDRIAFLTSQEVAEITGMSYVRVRWGIRVKEFFPVKVGKRNYFSVTEVRRILAKREGRTGQAKRGVSRIVVEWMRNYLREKQPAPVQTLDRMIKEASQLPEPAKSQTISRLWQLFEEVSGILLEIQKVVLEQSASSAGSSTDEPR